MREAGESKPRATGGTLCGEQTGERCRNDGADGDAASGRGGDVGGSGGGSGGSSRSADAHASRSAAAPASRTSACTPSVTSSDSASRCRLLDVEEVAAWMRSSLFFEPRARAEPNLSFLGIACNTNITLRPLLQQVSNVLARMQSFCPK